MAWSRSVGRFEFKDDSYKKLSCCRDRARDASCHWAFRQVTQDYPRSFEMTLLSRACVRPYRCSIENCIIPFLSDLRVNVTGTQRRIQDFGLGGALAGGLVDRSLHRGPGAEPRWGSGGGGRSPHKPEKMLRHEAKKLLTERKKSIQTDHCMPIS